MQCVGCCEYVSTELNHPSLLFSQAGQLSGDNWTDNEHSDWSRGPSQGTPSPFLKRLSTVPRMAEVIKWGLYKESSIFEKNQFTLIENKVLNDKHFLRSEDTNYLAKYNIGNAIFYFCKISLLCESILSIFRKI